MAYVWSQWCTRHCVFIIQYPIYMDPLIRVRPDFGVHVKGVQERLVNVVEERQLLAEV